MIEGQLKGAYPAPSYPLPKEGQLKGAYSVPSYPVPIIFASLLAVAQATQSPNATQVLRNWTTLRGLYASHDPRAGRSHAECEKIDARLLRALQKQKFVCY